MPQSKTEPRWLAACTVAMAAAVTPSLAAGAAARPVCPAATQQAVDAEILRNLERYCRSSWRNAGIRRQEWNDCSQQALAELMERISADGLSQAIHDRDSCQRRELNRTVWRIVQRWRRRPRPAALTDQLVASRDDHREERWNEVAAAADSCLTDRQSRILEMSRQGWIVRDIAAELGLSAARVSDEKYKAVRKLRDYLTA